MIGYWLKHLDELFERALPAALAAHDLSRREWQVLNVLASGDGDPRAALEPFDGVDDALRGLAMRGWTTGHQVTDEGRSAHAAITEHVVRFRRQAADGVSPDEYGLTVDVLRRMAANLEAAYTA